MVKAFIVCVLATSLLIPGLVRAEDVRAAIDANDAEFMADYAAGDTKALALAYTEDGVMLPPVATRVAGHAAIETLWKRWIDAGIKNLTLKATQASPAAIWLTRSAISRCKSLSKGGALRPQAAITSLSGSASRMERGE
jgi:ketosteroid isomerase-like protein